MAGWLACVATVAAGRPAAWPATFEAAVMPPSTLAVGTTNPGKVAAVNRALEAYRAFTTGWVVTVHKVASGVRDQVLCTPL